MVATLPLQRPRQRSFDDLGTPLVDATFCVLDLETTGGSPNGGDAITEVGAVKVRGGEVLGTFQTLVNPGTAIPPAITYLTGITQAMVVPAPRIESVLPSLVEFVGNDTVIVGHNVRFDMSFLQAAARQLGYARWGNRVVDTCALARRLVREEVPNLKLGTLAERFRLTHRPSHRALDDALATVDLLHLLLERAGTLGVLALEDLFELPTINGHPQSQKLKLTVDLPRKPGVYLFRDSGGRVLYVGKATDLRSRVRSYFSGDGRRKVDALLRETVRIDHVVTRGPLEAAVLEVRLIHEHVPRFNRRTKTWRRYAYLKLTLDERFPRLSVVRAVRAGDGCVYLGPLSSSGAAKQVAEAIESALPIRRCTKRSTRTPTAAAPCAPAQLGVSACPCSGDVDEATYARIVGDVVRALTADPTLVLDRLDDKMRVLAVQQRFEEAATIRDRASAFARAVARQRRLDGLRRSGRLDVEVPGEERAVLDGGRLVLGDAAELFPALTQTDDERRLADELACVAEWLDRRAGRMRLVSCDGELASPLPRLPTFEPR
ncbi:MAG TPA: DEDD exonuclease domain-containing protein [Acidimicrobiales bacterium]|nr:DEDD exonuclease domain-containing protein [Acidimicrobiales bacterium]